MRPCVTWSFWTRLAGNEVEAVAVESHGRRAVLAGQQLRSQCPLLEASACDLWMQLSSSCAVKCLSKRALGAGLRHIPVLLLRQLLPSTRACSAVPLSLGGSQSPRESGGPRARAQMSLLLKGWMEWRRSLWPRHAHRQPWPSSCTPRASPRHTRVFANAWSHPHRDTEILGPARGRQITLYLLSFSIRHASVCPT